jgi:hypothetical protein
MFVDIHIHPTIKPFTNDGNVFKEHINTKPKKNIAKWLISILTKTIPKYSQSDFSTLIQGNFRIVIISFFAIEREFFNSKILPKFLDKPIVSHLTGIPEEKFTDDYFQFLMDEMLWLINQQNNNTNLFQFAIAKNYTHIERLLKRNPNILCVIPSIEGIQSLLRYDEIDKPNKIDLIEERLDLLPLKPFFITLNHHFWNGISSHAQSTQKFLFNQESNFKGITDEGFRIIDLLLDKGILIDIKHLDKCSRKQYYDYIKGKNIPIICSHTGISTFNNLSDIKDDVKKNKISYFHELEINICGEDIREIVNSGGIIGLQLDRKRLVGSRNKITEKNYVEVVVANILKCVEFGGIQTWNHLAIGSDFDGMISHLPNVKKSSDITNLYYDILNFLICPKDIEWSGGIIYSVKDINNLIGDKCVKELVDRVFGLNSKEFLKRNFI